MPRSRESRQVIKYAKCTVGEATPPHPHPGHHPIKRPLWALYLSNPKPQTALSSPSSNILCQYKQIPGPIDTGDRPLPPTNCCHTPTDRRSGVDRHTVAPRAEAGISIKNLEHLQYNNRSKSPSSVLTYAPSLSLRRLALCKSNLSVVHTSIYP